MNGKLLICLISLCCTTAVMAQAPEPRRGSDVLNQFWSRGKAEGSGPVTLQEIRGQRR
jgi:hypothetical protein